MKRGWLLLIVLLCVAFLISCGKKTEPDEAKGELVRIEREADPKKGRPLSFFVILQLVSKERRVDFVETH